MEFLLSLVYPNVCGFCGEICKDSLCKKCEIKWKEQMEDRIRDYTNNDNFEFARHLYIFKYKDDIRNLLIDYKFNEKAYLYKTFTQIILKSKKIYGFLKECDIIIPVPIHKNRKKQRGYNQSELIAKQLVKQTKSLKLEKNVLLKQKDIKPQSTLDKNDRIKNIQNAYLIKNEEKILEKRVLLLDDIYTTGSTVNECSKILKKSGAKQVIVLTVAKD